MYKIFTFIVAVIGLYGFKVDLLPYADTSFRIDDILIFLYFITLLIIVLKGEPLPLPAPVQIMIGFVVWSLVSVLVNVQRMGIDLVQGALFSLRNIEYAVFFYVGYFYNHYRFSFSKFISRYLCYAALIGLLISFHIIKGYSRFGEFRLFSNTGGPYELAAICGFIIFYFLKRPLKALIASIMLYFTLSRITIVGTFLLVSLSKVRYFLAAVLFAVVVLAFVNTVSVKQNLVNRISAITDEQTVEIVQYLAENFEKVKNQADYQNMIYNQRSDTFLSQLGGDVSTSIRLNRWFTLLYAVFSDPLSAVVGLGPSFASVGVDGNYVRLLAESGIVGFCLYLGFLLSIIKFAFKTGNYVLRQYLFLVMLSAIFIDVLVSYKIMMLLWFYYGYCYYTQKNLSE